VRTPVPILLTAILFASVSDESACRSGAEEVSSSVLHGGSPDELACLSIIELQDQFKNTHRHSFPESKPMVLLVADRKGYGSLAPWVKSARALAADESIVLGIADVRRVPAFLRGKVRRKFEEGQDYPILLDWHGDVLENLRPTRGVANTYLIRPDGHVVLHLSGEATDAKLKLLRSEIEQCGAAVLSGIQVVKPAD